MSDDEEADDETGDDGFLDVEAGNDVETATTDSPYGEGSSSTSEMTSRDTDSSTRSRETAGTESQGQAGTAVTADSEPNPLTQGELGGRIRVDSKLFEDAVVPGTGYTHSLLFERMGKKNPVGVGREGERRFETFEETEEQLDELYEHLGEDVYPSVNLLKNDVAEAALIAGLWNPRLVQQILDSWGYEDVEQS